MGRPRAHGEIWLVSDRDRRQLDPRRLRGQSRLQPGQQAEEESVVTRRQGTFHFTKSVGGKKIARETAILCLGAQDDATERLLLHAGGPLH